MRYGCGAGTGTAVEASAPGIPRSRERAPIEAEEQKACADNGIEYSKAAYDGISVVVNSQNDFAKT